jgi:hypothetical protein
MFEEKVSQKQGHFVAEKCLLGTHRQQAFQDKKASEGLSEI